MAIGAVLWLRRLDGAGSSSRAGEGLSVTPPESMLAVTSQSGDQRQVNDSAATDTLALPVADPEIPAAPAAAVPLPVTTVPATPPPLVPQVTPNLRNVTWTRATARTYINVRTGADRKAPVVGVITPNMHVELGARLYGWRQVRAPGISGWADPRNFLADSGAVMR